MPLSVSQLNGTNGFKVTAGGSGLALAGDFNHDGFDDIVIGSWTSSPGGRAGAGETYVIYGQSAYASGTIAESAVTGAIGFTLNGVSANDSSGWSLAYTDINGDGIDDIAIGAPAVTVSGKTEAGAVYVVFGTTTPPASSIELSTLNGTNGFVLTGDTANNNARAGYTVSAGGDFNQDGIDDLLIGSPFPGSMFGPEHAYAYVLYGAATFAASMSLTSVTGTAGITYTGTFQNQTGRDMASIGDVNGDGRPDILVTDFWEASIGISNQPTVGHLYFGPPGAAVDAPVNWQISDEGPTNDVSAAGDFNGDGIDDFIVTLHGDEAFQYGRTESGVRINAAAVIVYGRTGGWEGVTNGLNSNKGFVLLSPDTSYTVGHAGDFNGDGLDDVIVSAGTAAYVVFGSNVPRADIDLRNLTPAEGLAITDVGTQTTVAGAGDVNNDGFDDVAITSNIGLGTFVVFGGPSGSSTGGGGNDALNGTGGNDNLNGLGGDDHLFGFGGNDRLDGGTGTDTMEGGTGNDTYIVDNAGDILVEVVGAGFDTVIASVDYRLTAGAEIEVLQPDGGAAGTNAINLFGNEFNNSVSGNAGVNYLRGANGDDVLTALGGDDFLNGDAGADTMNGGIGNDTYFIDNALDLVNELANEGNDRIATSVGYVLASGTSVEVLEAATLSGTVAMDLTGNALGQTISGNSGVNILRGEDGADILNGYDGTDYLIGGGGADSMFGGTGDDTYYVDDGGDLVTELAGQGNDRIASLVSYALAASSSVEVLEATNSTSTNAMDLTGSDIANVVAGNFGTNVLNGGGGDDVVAGYAGNDTLNGGDGNDVMNGGLGNDTMSGGLGNDKYYIEDAGDVLAEATGQGDDTAATNVSYTLAAGAEVEHLEPITFNSTVALDITGNELANSILGNNGANVLNGGAGNDVLEGLGGQDFFAFTTALGAGNVDRINDYLSSFDRFMLDHNIFTGLTPGGLAANQFVSGSAAADTDDRIIYNPANGAVLFDADGTGAIAAIQFATLNDNLNITAADFLVI